MLQDSKIVRVFGFALALIVLTSFASARSERPGSHGWNRQPIRIIADLTQSRRRLYAADIYLPVTPGRPASFTTPLWVPGNHAPTGKGGLIAGLRFGAVRADGSETNLPWTRDETDLFKYHVVVPPGVAMLHVRLEAAVSYAAGTDLACLEWDRIMMYPADVPARSIAIQPSVRLPAGWSAATSLIPESRTAQAGPELLRFAATTVEQLQDSPIFAGQNFREYRLAPAISPAHYLDVVAEDPADLNVGKAMLDKLSAVVREALAAYGPPHYAHYRFLVSLARNAGGEGLEHAQSSDDGLWAGGLSDPVQILAFADILPHEFTHSWNGKYRRPSGLYQPTFATPQSGRLLWVYEGLTTYMGDVLAVRSGLRTPAQFRDLIALTAARLDNEPGRAWRSTQDTAIAAAIDRNPTLWANWLRGQDFYYEGELVWLDVDMIIRQRTAGRRSLTDFLHMFFSHGGSGKPAIVPYDEEEIIADLQRVAPYDWRTFFHRWIEVPTPHPDLDGLARAGYRLNYAGTQTATEAALLRARGGQTQQDDFWYSLGVRLSESGGVDEVRYDGPADKAGLVAGMTITGVNGQPFSFDTLDRALATGATSLGLSAERNGHKVPVDLHFEGGPRFPMLERQSSRPDLFDALLKPLA